MPTGNPYEEGQIGICAAGPEEDGNCGSGYQAVGMETIYQSLNPGLSCQNSNSTNCSTTLCLPSMGEASCIGSYCNVSGNGYCIGESCFVDGSGSCIGYTCTVGESGGNGICAGEGCSIYNGSGSCFGLGCVVNCAGTCPFPLTTGMCGVGQNPNLCGSSTSTTCAATFNSGSYCFNNDVASNCYGYPSC